LPSLVFSLLVSYKKIEWVQKSFTKRLNCLSALLYSDRLIWLGADSLATRRLKFDLVLFYDIVHDNIDVDLPPHES